mmetsp:Transcript_9600/g.16748  ORF Transcript_9600/g.16748 Transcript_9600/m.16748 type:complete len:169 (-) Transcript_9600:2985-3491(-)
MKTSSIYFPLVFWLDPFQLKRMASVDAFTCPQIDGIVCCNDGCADDEYLYYPGQALCFIGVCCFGPEGETCADPLFTIYPSMVDTVMGAAPVGTIDDLQTNDSSSYMDFGTGPYKGNFIFQVPNTFDISTFGSMTMTVGYLGPNDGSWLFQIRKNYVAHPWRFYLNAR